MRCSRVSETPATYVGNRPYAECPGSPIDEELTPAGNPDIRVSKDMKIVAGQRTRRVVVEDEETDVGEKNESTTTDVGSTEEDEAEGVLPRGEEENISPRPLDSQDEIQD
ncbi:hypothetical protein NDU88_002386 [Pleurodeles waltl]|uniref:Uncharacterized protein n=1 Tax=Pleurodeles waltl TaxID=8319 RepID=A0AAV7T2L3_PLEWA|nr:hypothetical protein NDU88_002386 [Pleurodeles waltl]